MKNNWLLPVIAGLSLIHSGCTSEAPFSTSGESLVRMNLNLNSVLTRASDDDLMNECNIYISDNVGVLYKWEGVKDIPSQGIYMKPGNYLAEAWAGEMDEPSFDKKQYWGRTNFTIGTNEVTTQVSINCNLTNIVGSVDPEGLDESIVNSLKVIFSTSKGKLELSETNLKEKAYFPVNFDSTNQPENDVLTYTVTGKYLNGEEFNITKSIDYAYPGYEYQIAFKNSSDSSTPNGGALFEILVREYELVVDDEVTISTGPKISWAKDADGFTPALSDQLFATPGSFITETLLVAAYKDFKSLSINFIGVSGINKNISLLDEGSLKTLAENNINVLKEIFGNNNCQYRITFSDRFLNLLPTSNKEYSFEVKAEDISGKMTLAYIRVANSEEALDCPFKIDETHWTQYPMSILIDNAEIPVTYIRSGNFGEIFVQYRKKGEEEWTTEPVVSKQINSVTSTAKDGILLSNLDRGEDGLGGIMYECRLVGGNWDGENYQYISPISTFTTESVFQIPNASMEEWYKNDKVWMPMPNNGNSFWDTGNHGSTTISENDNLTTQETGIKHSGNSSAKLYSKFVGLVGIGKHGAGNIFSGTYAGTSGTNGIIDFGQKYNNSHPKSVRVFANYRPAEVTRDVSGQSFLSKGDMDKGQIYIALATEKIRVSTADKSTLINPDSLFDEIIAYNQVTFDNDFGAEGELKEIVIDFEYNDRAYNNKPEYLIIVCTASKYGDYFVGGEGSTMYVDDFELIY